MPASRPDLDQELRQQLLDRFLRDYDRDRRDDKTVRSLHEAFERHVDDDKKAFESLDEKIDSARLEVARHEGMIDTGRFQLPPPQQLPPTQINIGTPKSSKRPSMPPFWQKIVEKPLLVVLIALASVLAHAIVHLLK